MKGAATIVIVNDQIDEASINGGIVSYDGKPENATFMPMTLLGPGINDRMVLTYHEKNSSKVNVMNCMYSTKTPTLLEIASVKPPVLMSQRLKHQFSPEDYVDDKSTYKKAGGTLVIYAGSTSKDGDKELFTPGREAKRAPIRFVGITPYLVINTDDPDVDCVIPDEFAEAGAISLRALADKLASSKDVTVHCFKNGTEGKLGRTFSSWARQIKLELGSGSAISPAFTPKR
jgi:hypothetical protein